MIKKNELLDDSDMVKLGISQGQQYDEKVDVVMQHKIKKFEKDYQNVENNSDGPVTTG